MPQSKDDAFNLMCQNCGNIGTAHFEAHKDPVYPGLSIPTLKSLSEGFSTRGGQNLRESVIFCTRCNTEVPHSSF